MQNILRHMLVAVILGAAIFVIYDVDEAQAQSRLCRGLFNQLSALDNSRSNKGGNSKQYRKYSDAVRKQQIEISKTSRIAKRNRCTSRGIFKNRSAQCRRVVSSLNKMKSNLSGLKRKRDQFAPRQTRNSRKRRILLARIQRNGCNYSSNNQQRQVKADRKSKRRTLIEQIFGIRTYRDSGNLSNSYEEDSLDQGFRGSTYRTLCVRKTDGYYFPISFSTTKDFFERDEQACISMCPGVNVGLYHHRMPSQDSESMVAYGSEFPYAKESFAFAYRKTIDRNSQCNFALREFKLDGNNKRTQVANAFIAHPEFKTDPTISPDDEDTLFGRLSIESIKLALIDANTPNADPVIARPIGDRKVRIVGPAFFPVQ